MCPIYKGYWCYQSRGKVKSYFKEFSSPQTVSGFDNVLFKSGPPQLMDTSLIRPPSLDMTNTFLPHRGRHVSEFLHLIK